MSSARRGEAWASLGTSRRFRRGAVRTPAPYHRGRVFIPEGWRNVAGGRGAERRTPPETRPRRSAPRRRCRNAGEPAGRSRTPSGVPTDGACDRGCRRRSTPGYIPPSLRLGKKARENPRPVGRRCPQRAGVRRGRVRERRSCAGARLCEPQHAGRVEAAAGHRPALRGRGPVPKRRSDSRRGEDTDALHRGGNSPRPARDGPLVFDYEMREGEN